MKYLSKNILLRINEDVLKQINDQVGEFNILYGNRSHFLRVAINRELNRKKTNE